MAPIQSSIRRCERAAAEGSNRGHGRATEGPATAGKAAGAAAGAEEEEEEEEEVEDQEEAGKEVGEGGGLRGEILNNSEFIKIKISEKS